MEYDKQYAQTYGTGIIIASDQGLPFRDKFDKSQIELKNGASCIKGGVGATFCIRGFLKDGKDYNFYLGLLRKGYKPENIIEGSERIVLQVWASHSIDGKTEMKTDSVWPKKLGDTPDWTDFGLKQFDISEVLDYKDTGADWANMTSSERPYHFQGGSLEKWLASAKTGYKLYLQLYVSLVVNHKWDEDNQRWITMLCKSEPLAAGTIEVK